MSNPSKYDPEDIESLLRHKSFAELYEAERQFVLRHMESAEEYEAMRTALLLVEEDRKQGQELLPDPAIKTALLQEFEQRGPRPVIWLNAAPMVDKLRERPIQALAVAASLALAITIGAWWWTNATPGDQPIAQEKGDTTQQMVIRETSDPVAVEDSTTVEVVEEEREAPAVVEKTPSKDTVVKTPVEPEPIIAYVEPPIESESDEPVDEKSLGRSFAEDAALEDLFYTAL
ncbi:MAG: hypothetical protein ACFB10_24375 [Salibacteraceae bacterium]